MRSRSDPGTICAIPQHCPPHQLKSKATTLFKMQVQQELWFCNQSAQVRVQHFKVLHPILGVKILRGRPTKKILVSILLNYYLKEHNCNKYRQRQLLFKIQDQHSVMNSDNFFSVTYSLSHAVCFWLYSVVLRLANHIKYFFLFEQQPPRLI